MCVVKRLDQPSCPKCGEHGIYYTMRDGKYGEYVKCTNCQMEFWDEFWLVRKHKTITINTGDKTNE